ncbi:curli production assembly/transport component CsgE [Desulfobotulus alkaliphilus]|uniref:Curli production assembly/transport component CsgE n=1 Tax=Desulfobotulus alkaliphilus TaxID=622671 RepID=A0A562S9P4_9BACT|nr:CsgE family curli-type amyloid fiber assembly protein [Desulfobotulus alkaliphilus]TWI77226.1 curli production assembly/transport component CsgE [Desulfobotulus alkaliphilus]
MFPMGLTNKIKIFCAISLFIFWFIPCASPQDVELDNLIIQKTMTPRGHEFYRLFSSRWNQSLGTDLGWLLVQERASARWGSQIFIHINDRPIYRLQLSPRNQALTEDADKAVQAVQMILLRMQMEESSGNSPDLVGNGY